MSILDFPDISISGLQPRVFDARAVTAGIEYISPGSVSYKSFRYNPTKRLSLAEELGLGTVGDFQVEPFCMLGSTITNVAFTSSLDSAIRRHLPLFDQLPLEKKLDLISALQKIHGEITEIEYNDEGEIIIETRESGHDCFYAISTQEGDFKGTWLSNGTLLRQPWPANPRSGSRIQQLI